MKLKQQILISLLFVEVFKRIDVDNSGFIELDFFQVLNFLQSNSVLMVIHFVFERFKWLFFFLSVADVCYDLKGQRIFMNCIVIVLVNRLQSYR